MAERDLSSARTPIQKQHINRLHIFLYNIPIVQQLKDRHYAARTCFGN